MEGKALGWKKLEEVCQFINGINVKTNDLERGISVVLGKNLEEGRVKGENFPKADVDLNSPRIKAAIIGFEEIVMIKDGSVGKLGINLTDQTFLAGSTAFKITPKDCQILSKKYLYYFLRGNEGNIKNCIKLGTSIHHLDLQKFSKIEIFVPSMTEQLRIVKVLDSFTELEKELEFREKEYEYYRNLLIKGPTDGPPPK